MAHLHSVYDSDMHFSISPITRAIRNESDKKSLVQYDHKSERFTFELPRYVEEHDMSLCNRVEIHYINIGSGKEQNEDVYEVDDLQISPDDNGVVICSWLVSANATQLAGSLSFLLRFACVADDGTIEYAWHTEIFKGITISDGMNNGEAVIIEYSDVLEAWKAEILAEIEVSENTAFLNDYYYGDPMIFPSPIEEFTYREEENVVYLTGLTQEAAYDDIVSVVIPYEAFEKKVAIAQYDFESISSYTETLILPRGLQMGGYNFGYGSYITKLVLPEGVDAIKSKCFRDLYNLSEVRIPEGVISIQGGAFTGCTGLKRIYIPDSVTDFNDSTEEDAPFKGAEASATIVCSQGSAAEAYAKKRGFAIEYTGIIIDDKPTESSKNAVSSGGVYEAIGDIETALDGIISLQEALIGGDSV